MSTRVVARRRRSVALGLLVLSCSALTMEQVTCHTDAAHIYVRTGAHRLSLCKDGRALKSYGVRLGKGGVGKRREGDGKTPLGVYNLGSPRPSSKYGVFIPIGYPTSDQRVQGFTGSDVGVHGPHRALAWLGRYVNALDTTDGCVGVATDSEMNEIAAWLSASSATSVVIE